MSAVYDYIGIGFGPSNLALAIATEEYASRRGLSTNFCFLEKKPAFAWHEGMLIDGTTMQISFLKDLATLRDPTSRFTFINYLKQQGRLEDFINLQTFFPSREEFNDYLSWAATAFAGCTHYGEDVWRVEPYVANDQLVGVEVLSRDAQGQTRRRRARNLVLGIGGRPQRPAAFESLDDPRVFHSSRYRRDGESLLADNKSTDMRVAVIGAGQSAAEIFYDLTCRFEHVKASLIMRGSALKPSDDSPFVNEIFNPSFTSQIFTERAERRTQLLREFRNTNYSVVDLDLIERIYEVFYLQKVRGIARHELLNNRDVIRAEPGPTGIELSLRDKCDGQLTSRRFDAVILATGYRRDYHRELLAGLDDYIESTVVDRHYRIGLRSGNGGPCIYLQGCCESSHGISDTLLSVLAARSQEVAESIFAMPESERLLQAERAAWLSQVT